MFRHVPVIRTDVSEECSASIIRVTGLDELGTTLASCLLLITAAIVPSSLLLVTLMIEALHSSKTSIFTRAIWRNIPEDGIFKI
jgi:hypothetical protein